MPDYDALLIVSFGGPEGPDEVLPFLENVLRGRNVPRQRMLAVAEHYQHFGGVSPLNQQNRALAQALRQELEHENLKLPVYLGNRNWHPLLPDVLCQMRSDGVRRALGFFTSPYSSYSSCRQYRENIAAAQKEVGSQAPQIDKLRAYYNHPGFIEAVVDRARQAVQSLRDEDRPAAQWLFTAHSIPLPMARSSRYEEQLREASRLVAQQVDAGSWRLVYQSRSGPPHQAWLEPDIGDVLKELAATDTKRPVVVVPIGFISDHMEVVYDLDTEAQQLANQLGLVMIRVPTVGTHPRFVQMIRELIVERLEPREHRPALGQYGPSHDVCPADCCPNSA